MLLTGTATSLPSLIFDDPRFDPTPQRSKLGHLWLDYEYDEAEVYLMLLRQVQDISTDKLWVPVQTDYRPVHPADVVLSLALYLSHSGFAATESSPWKETGQVVFPSIEDIVAAISSTGKKPSDPHTDAQLLFDGSIGRLTLRNAQEAMRVPEVKVMAEASRRLIMRRLWETGLLARGLASINNTERSVSSKISAWIKEYGQNPSFRCVMRALLRLVRQGNPNWLEEYWADPIRPMPIVPLDAVHDDVERQAVDGELAPIPLTALKS